MTSALRSSGGAREPRLRAAATLVTVTGHLWRALPPTIGPASPPCDPDAMPHVKMKRTTRRTDARPPTAETIRHLHELISALDRRVTHVERSGEASIARAAAALKAEATKRIADLEREAAAGPVHINVD
jgi:hypothetical protein